jgi:hypothetical protein
VPCCAMLCHLEILDGSTRKINEEMTSKV